MSAIQVVDDAVKGNPKAYTILLGPVGNLDDYPSKPEESVPRVPCTYRKIPFEERIIFPNPRCKVEFDKSKDYKRYVAIEPIPKDTYVLVEDSILFILQERDKDRSIHQMVTSTCVLLTEKNIDLKLASDFAEIMPRYPDKDTRYRRAFDLMNQNKFKTHVATRASRLAAKITRNAFQENGCLLLFITAS